MNYFPKHKAKKIPKASQTVKKQANKSDIKSVLKRTKQLNIVTRELETVGKPNIFDIKSVTIEHPKTFAELSKRIKQP